MMINAMRVQLMLFFLAVAPLVDWCDRVVVVRRFGCDLPMLFFFSES